MRRPPRSRARAIAYAVPQDQRRANLHWIALAAGLLTSIAIYSVAAILM